MAELPEALRRVPYVGALVPGAEPGLGVTEGANCQRYAYAVLRHFGRMVPALRSRELWLDTASTVTVEEPQPLDLVLFGPTPDPYGAHVGVCLGGTEVLHLSSEVGLPAVWGFDAFAARERYQTRIGYKRAIAGAHA